MSDLLPFIVAGLVIGAIYGLAGLGLVITYKTSGIFNFAHPALAALGAFSFHELHGERTRLDWQLPWPVAAAVVVLAVGPLLGLLMSSLARRLALVAAPLQIVATVGISLGIIGLLGLLRGRLRGRSFLPTGTFELLGTFIRWDQLILFVFAVGAAVSLSIWLRLSRLGMAMRAVVDNPDLVELTGSSAASVSRRAWMLGTVFAVVSGVLLTASNPRLGAMSLFLLMIASFGAAAVGGFSSLPLTFVGGLLTGIAGALTAKWPVGAIGGLQPAMPYLVLLVALLVTRRRHLLDRRVTKPRPIPRSFEAPWRIRVATGAVVVAVLAAAPLWAGRDLVVWTSMLIYTLLALSAGLLVRESGQVSLCQTVFAAVGLTTFAHGVNDWHLSWVVAVLVAGAVAGGVGLVLAIPATRVSGVFLAVATLGFGLAMANLVYPTGLMFTTAVDGLGRLPRPGFAQSNEAMHLLVVALVTLVAIGLVAVHHGRLGRLLRGLDDSALALETMGTGVNTLRAVVFALSAWLAGVAGALYGSYFRGAGLSTPFFQPMLSLQLFAVVVIVPGATPWYGLLGAAALQLAPYYAVEWFDVAATVGPWSTLIFGAAAVTVAVRAAQGHTLARWHAYVERYRDVRPVEATGDVRPRRRAAGTGLRVDGLTVRFGGVVAVNALSLDAPLGHITGLIGPNGAGKTTTFNACSGLLTPGSGSISFNGRDISRLPPAARAQLGIGRTFQRCELWDSLSVYDNVALGAEASAAGARAWTQLRSSARDVVEIRNATHGALELTEMAGSRDRIVGDLSAGERRLVELARVLAGPFELLLLDEPSSGLDRLETARFGVILRRVVEERGTGVLLVEHDMSLVLTLCHRVHVMDFGRKVDAGTPEEIQASDSVRLAYLGVTGVAG